MNRKKKVLIIAGIIILIIQFIQPAHNKSQQQLPTDISKIHVVPDTVQKILNNSCYDCHSNNTRYPWYFNIQPVGWFLANHIKTGKANLNFSEFGSYSTRKQANKLRAISETIKDRSMPISSYTLIHTDAKLSEKQKDLIKSWVLTIHDSLMEKH